eukprot:COSAG06_NODE_3559_length_5187_cov_13.975236_5_plen_419_part_00
MQGKYRCAGVTVPTQDLLSLFFALDLDGQFRQNFARYNTSPIDLSSPARGARHPVPVPPLRVSDRCGPGQREPGCRVAARRALSTYHQQRHPGTMRRAASVALLAAVAPPASSAAASALSTPGDDGDGLVVDCYLRTAIDPAKCTSTPEFDLLQMDWNKTWSAPDPGINCCGTMVLPHAPEPFALGIPLAQCKQACENYSSIGCTAIIVSATPFNRSCMPSHALECPDLCTSAPTQCSPEICDLRPGQVQRLKPGTYYHNKQIFLPAGSAIIGAGINVTHIVACGRQLASGCNMTERRGFLMGDDTYVGNFSFTGRENKRSGCPLGGGLIETPGCQGDYCGLHKNPPPGAPLCNPPGRNLEECVGITNATAEFIHLHAWTMDHVGWFPPTVPWVKKRQFWAISIFSCHDFTKTHSGQT